MAQFLENLLTASIHGSIVILAVILLRLVLRKTPRKYICLLWLLAGIRLLLPIEIRSDLSLQPEFTLPMAELSGLQWAGLMPWIWGAVACCFGIYSLVSYLKLKNQVREAVRIRGGWECDRIDTAFILGFIKPRIYIPMGMNSQSRRHILAHERTHLDKGDHWIKMIGFLALALHWFNPLVWVAYLMLCKDIEMACDERVVQFMEIDERKSYSAALLSCSSRQMHFAASPVAFGEVSVKQRIKSVLKYKRPSFWISLLGVLAFFFVAICLMTSPENTADTPLSPEQQAQRELLQQCREDMEALFAKEEFYYDVIGIDGRGSVLWTTDLYKQGDNTMWKYNPASSPDVEDGRLELGRQHYAYQSGSWVQTDSGDTEFESWLNLFSWDLNGAEYLEEKQLGDGREVTFTTKWEGEDQTVHTAANAYFYASDGELRRIRVEKPNHPTADGVHLDVIPASQIFNEPKSVSDFFAEAEGAITDGMVTSEELALQAELADWEVFFRVDDDRLSSVGVDVYFSQGENGRGAIATGDGYWIEKKVAGAWEKLPTLSEPSWTDDDNVGVGKGTSTYGYLDWTGLYGRLEPGDYRLGKTFICRDQKTSYVRSHDFYSEFTIFESVDSSSPEAAAAVERCYAELEELKQRDHLHWLSVSGRESQEEYWVNGDDYLNISQWNGPDVPLDQWTEHEKNLLPRVDTSVRYNGIGYVSVNEDPEVPSSKVIGMGLSTLSPNRAGWNHATIADDFNMSFFERSNKSISFPEGVGVIRDDLVRFRLDWPTAGGEEYWAQMTYKFDGNGDLCYMEYMSSNKDRNGDPVVFYIEIFDTSAEEIDAKIKPYTENLVVGGFSWEEAKAKYTDADFNIREDSFVNTGSTPITGPVDAAVLALKEYPNLGEYLSIDVSRDQTAGMWKVTVQSYVDYQATYAYRDIYLSDSGATRLLVYEGPIRFDESRK